MYSPSLISLLRSPQTVSSVTHEQWNDIVVAARKNQMLGQLAARLQQAGVLDVVPPQVRRHLALDLLTALRRSESALWEVASMRRSVNAAIPLVFIKGCAYALSADHNSAGRRFSDIDVMVRHQALGKVEATLISVGWKPSHVDDYDAAYYRNWMHEVPPMEHVRRNTVVDLHHAINPPVSRHYVNPDKLFEGLVEVAPGIFVLPAVDRVIHCALHLLQEGEPKKLLRDLYDLYLLVNQHFPMGPGIRQVSQRATELGVEALVLTAMAAAMEIFALHSTVIAPQNGLLRACVVRAALGQDAKSLGLQRWLCHWAGIAVLAHSHWMKMPLRMLVPHLLHKSLVGMKSDKTSKS